MSPVARYLKFSKLPRKNKRQLTDKSRLFKRRFETLPLEESLGGRKERESGRKAGQKSQLPFLGAGLER